MEEKKKRGRPRKTIEVPQEIQELIEDVQEKRQQLQEEIKVETKVEHKKGTWDVKLEDPLNTLTKGYLMK